MSGIGGIARVRDGVADVDTLLRMAASLRHRGPDGCGIAVEGAVGLVHVRVDLDAPASGAQPVPNEDDRVVAVCAGEIVNEAELRAELERYAHRFRTRCGAEVLVHAYEQWGVAMLQRLHGEFAVAIHDRARDTLLLARDRHGVHPLFYAVVDAGLVFGSEVKALLATGAVQARPDFAGLDEIFTLSGACAPRTPFAGVSQLEPASYGIWRNGRFRATRYYELPFIESELEPFGAVTTLDSLLHDSVARRLGAGARVGVHRDGALDTRIVCGLAARQRPRIPVFTLGAPAAPEDAAAPSAGIIAGGAEEHVVRLRHGEVAGALRHAVWHTESPLMQLEPAAMYLLGRAAREHGVQVMLGGEGAAELFLGHDLFKETVVRLFCLQHPDSRVRPSLFTRIHPELRDSGRAGEFWLRAILSVSHPSEPLFSHMPRFALAARVKDFYSADTRLVLAGADPLAELRRRLPPAFASWSPLNRAAYLELATRLPSYALSSRSDRVMAAHGVEVRHPFLDHRVAEFAAMLPAGSRLRGLREMDILRRWAQAMLPTAASTGGRPADPVGVAAFFGDRRPAYVDELLSREAIAAAGFFDIEAVEGLVRRCRTGRVSSVAESQAFVAILSTQLWFQHFIASPFDTAPLPLHDAEVVMTREAVDGSERAATGALA